MRDLVSSPDVMSASGLLGEGTARCHGRAIEIGVAGHRGLAIVLLDVILIHIDGREIVWPGICYRLAGVRGKR